MREHMENNGKHKEENIMGNKYFIVRGNRSGVFFGKIAKREGREVEMAECRRLWYWEGAAARSQLALEGVTRPVSCKFTVTVPEAIILDAIELIPCSDKAVESINGVKVWKM